MLVLALEEQVEQGVEALGEILLALVHRGRDVHEAEHDRLAQGPRDHDAVAIAQVDLVEEGHPGDAPAQPGDLLGERGVGRRLLVGIAARLDLGEPAPRGARERDAPPERLAQRACHREVGRRALRRVAGALRPALAQVADHVAHHVRQLEVVEEERHELFARQGEGEAVLGIAAALAAAVALAAGATGRAPDAVTGVELAVARMDCLAIATRPVADGGLGDVPVRDMHRAALFHVADRALRDHVGHRALQVRLVAAHEAGAVDRALVPIVQSSVDDY